MNQLTRVLAPVDLKSISWEALGYAGWFAGQTGSIVDLLYVVPDDVVPDDVMPDVAEQAAEDAQDLFFTLLATLTMRFSMGEGAADGRSDPIFIGNIQPGDPADRIVAFAERGAHDLIVMGSDRPQAQSYWGRGHVAQSVVQRARNPVLVVPRAIKEDLFQTHVF